MSNEPSAEARLFQDAINGRYELELQLKELKGTAIYEEVMYLRRSNESYREQVRRMPGNISGWNPHG